MGIDSISANYGAYNNYAAYNDDFMAKQLLNNNPYAVPVSSQSYDSVSFAGKKEDPQDVVKKGNFVLGTVLVGGAIAIGGFLLGKNWKSVKGWLNKLLNGKTATKAKTALEKAKDKVWEYIQPSKKAKIKGTSVTGAAKPVTNASEAKVMQNINTQHVNGNTQRAVQNGMNDIVTPEMQAAYDKSIAYNPLTKKQKTAKAALDSANKAQRAELNSIANNSRGVEGLETVAQAAKKAENAAKIIKDGAHLDPVSKNIYFTKNGQVTQIRTAVPNSKGEFTITDPVKIAKHLEKNKIDLEKFTTNNISQAA